MRLILFMGLALAACSPTLRAPQAAEPRAPVPTPDGRMAVERGLIPAVLLAGRPAPSWSIEDRMARYRVPGLSIAMIDGGELAWVAGYGVKEHGGDASVSPETLYQAASISKAVAAVGALRLVQEGRLELDGDIGLHLGGRQLPRDRK